MPSSRAPRRVTPLYVTLLAACGNGATDASNPPLFSLVRGQYVATEFRVERGGQTQDVLALGGHLELRDVRSLGLPFYGRLRLPAEVNDGRALETDLRGFLTLPPGDSVRINLVERPFFDEAAFAIRERGRRLTARDTFGLRTVTITLERRP